MEIWVQDEKNKSKGFLNVIEEFVYVYLKWLTRISNYCAQEK